MKIASQTGLAPGETLAERIAFLAAAGYEGIEIPGRALMSDPDSTIRACTDSPLPVAAVCARFGGCLLDAREEAKTASA